MASLQATTANTKLLRKGVFESLGTLGAIGAATTTPFIVALPAEYWGARITYQVQLVSGTLTGITGNLIGSLDGTNWHALDAPGSGLGTTVPATSVGNVLYGSSVDTVSGCRLIAFLFATLTGTSPQVSVVIGIQ